MNTEGRQLIDPGHYLITWVPSRYNGVLANLPRVKKLAILTDVSKKAMEKHYSILGQRPHKLKNMLLPDLAFRRPQPRRTRNSAKNRVSFLIGAHFIIKIKSTLYPVLCIFYFFYYYFFLRYRYDVDFSECPLLS
jgi:hypothetical protein